MERKNFPGLTGIRALAAITIALFHFKDSLYAAFPKTQFLDDWISNGSIFVMFFFILSGFLLFHNYGNKELFTVKSFLRFFVNRIARLLPVSIITQFFAIPILCISIEKYGNWGAPIPNWYSFGYWLKNAFLLWAIDMPYKDYQWNQPAWSASAEVIAYVCFPVFVAVSLLIDKVFHSREKQLSEEQEKLSITQAVRNIVNTFAACMFIYIGQNLFREDQAYGWLISSLFYFLGGVWLRRVTLTKGDGRILGQFQWICPLLILISIDIKCTNFIGVLFLLFIYSMTAEDGMLVKLFSLRVFQIAGKMSYSFYMIHWCVFGMGALLRIAHPILIGTPYWIKLFTIGLWVILIISSYLLWKFVEEPCAHMIKKMYAKIESFVWKEKN